jgi:hypothetical protein
MRPPHFQCVSHLCVIQSEAKNPVLLFDYAYLETRNGEGVICCDCYRRIEDGDQQP